MQGKTERSATQQVYIGCDVSKSWLDIFILPLGQAMRVSNDKQGIGQFKRALRRLDVALVVMEATGRWHRPLWRALADDGFAVTVVDPYRARRFAQATGHLEKTDRIDARLLAMMAECLRPEARQPVSKALEELQEMVNLYHATKAELTARKNRHKAATSTLAKRETARMLRETQRQLQRLERLIRQAIGSDPQLADRYAILVSIPGVGPVTAATLLALLQELGSLPAKAIAKLAGVAPLVWESGQSQAARHIRGGRKTVRNMLYMAAISAGVRGANPHLKRFYDHLRRKGKPAKVAITAVMRKIVVLANTLIAENRIWTPEPPQSA